MEVDETIDTGMKNSGLVYTLHKPLLAELFVYQLRCRSAGDPFLAS